MVWAGVFVILSVVAIITGSPPWPVVFGVSLVLTAWLIRLEMAQPSYHGVGWRRFNPGLEDWWREHYPDRSGD